MKNRIIVVIVTFVTTLVFAAIAGLSILAAPGASGQLILDDTAGENSSALNGTTANSNATEDDGVATTTTTGANDSSVSLGNITGTTSTITVHDTINSTYTFSKEDEDASDRIDRVIREWFNDLLHTVARNNATIISTSTITNELLDESTTVNNSTRLFEVLETQIDLALDRIRAASQPSNSTLELHTDIEMVCINNDTSFADCVINMNIR